MHIVYVCSSNRIKHLFLSLQSLLASGTSFERVTIYCVGAPFPLWPFNADRITVEQAPDMGEGFWMINKIHLCRADGNEVVFLDTDTIVLKPLERLFDNMTGDIAGRLTTVASKPSWSEQLWEEWLRKYEAKNYFPYLNTGLLVFRNAAHRNLGDSWMNITREIGTANFRLPDIPRRANQLAFSLACGAIGISYSLLSPQQHTYGWMKESYDHSIVLHTGNNDFYKYAIKVDSATGSLNNNLSVYRPSLLWHYIIERAMSPLVKAENVSRRVLEFMWKH